ncbi:MAG TPA: phage protein Gp27 family protein [Stellaceae bacterium]|nr:phage protein Gp27 family protein [Stellaceae bacterium]
MEARVTTRGPRKSAAAAAPAEPIALIPAADVVKVICWSRDLIKGLADIPDDGGEGSFRLVVELMHAAIADLLLTPPGKPAMFDPDTVQMLAKVLELVAKARRTDAETMLKLKNSGQPAEDDQPRGLSGETVRAIKERILGIRPA